MKKIQFLNTELYVTPLCLGTVNYGTDLPEKDSIHQLEVYTGMGGNFIDTAHVYGDWQPGWGPLSETAIGKWLKDYPEREKLVISTKGGHPPIENKHLSRLTDADILSDLESSLRLLQTDYVDLYFLHRDDPRRPVEEFVELLEKQVKEGRIRYYGCSNWSLPRIREANAYAKEKGYRGFAVNQLMWSLADIRKENLSDDTLEIMDHDTYRYMGESGMNVMAYTSMAQGYFSRRMAGKELPEGVKAVYAGKVNDRIFALLQKARAESGVSEVHYTVRYITDGHPFPAVPIASFGSDAHLKEAMESIDAPVDPALLQMFRQWKN